MQLFDLGAAEAVDGMKIGVIRPQEYLDAILSRIEATEPIVNAWEYIDSDEARRSAEELDADPQARSRLPLFGLPVGVKDVIHVRGQPTRADFEPYRGRVAAEDSGVAQALRDAGAILLGKTVAAQFAWSQDQPKTRNPWNTDHTAGASTTGSPAAVAARQIPVGIGTQTTSSLLRPSAYCGVVGMKPTYGRLSSYGVIPTSWSSDHPGLVTRSVRDAAFVLGPLARHDPRDPHSAVESLEDFVAEVDQGDVAPKLARVVDLFDLASTPVRDAADRAVAQLAQHGAEVRDVHLPMPMELLLAIHWIIHNGESAAIHYEQYSQEHDHYLPTVRTNVEVSELLPAALYVHARRWKRRLRPMMAELLSGIDALVAPTSSDTAPRIDAGRASHRLGDPSFQIPWTCFGLPNITLPTDVGMNHLPNALQFIGGAFADARVLRTASWCEKVFGSPASPL